ncbi:TIR domain-containing protein [Curtobacterium sp. MCLR17_044]|uniref:TIR domain-containing protein n=1 Tax=Curtobacterium sp. MCLR17_044 TaxID=2175628 RepID=UPI0015E88B97|nr:TIR domain-containing protein [Curtobacterium sp. MCLR17_044]
MESSQLAGLRPTAETVQAVVNVLARHAGERIKQGSILLSQAKTKADRLWWDGYDAKWERFRSSTDHSYLVDTGLASITRSGRTRTGGSTSAHERRVFDVLAEADVESVTVEFSAWESDVQSLKVEFTPWATSIALEPSFSDDRLPSSLSIEEIEEALQTSAEPWQQPLQPIEPLPFRVFLGHGGDAQWKDLRDSLRDHHGFDVEAFERSPRVGQTISEVVRGMIAASSAGVLVFTRSDEMADGSWHGRQNVVHELGFVQGALGWGSAIIVLEEGVVLPSNLDGTQQVRFSQGHIREAEGAVAAALRLMRERPLGICP